MSLNAKVMAIGLLLTISSAASIQYSTVPIGVTPTGDPITRFNYVFSDIDLSQYQEIEIRFSPAYFMSVFNAIAPVPSFSALALNVNNPPGADGTYSIVTLVMSPSFGGTFSIDTELVGSVPTFLPYYVNQMVPGAGNDFVFVARLSSGTATLTGVPEPASSLSVALGLMMIAAASWCVRHRRNRCLPSGTDIL